MSPIQEEMRVIDTRRNARPGGPTSHASVRKYICESCALEMGGAMGMVPAQTHETTRQMLVEETARSAQYLAELEAARSTHVNVVPVVEISDAVVEAIREELAKQAKPVPRKRAAASDE